MFEKLMVPITTHLAKRESQFINRTTLAAAHMDSGFVSNAPLIRTPGIRTKLHTLLHRPSETSAGRYLRIATFIVILLSTLCFVLQSIPSCHSFAGGFLVIDGLVAVAFTIEYVIKFVVARWSRRRGE